MALAVRDDPLGGGARLSARRPEERIASGAVAQDGALECFIPIAGLAADDETVFVEYAVEKLVVLAGVPGQFGVRVENACILVVAV